MFSQNHFKKKRVRTIQFRCERISLLSGGKVCDPMKKLQNFSRPAHNLHDFLFLIHWNVEKEKNAKIFWKDIVVKNIERLDGNEWKSVYYNEEDIGSIKLKTPR